VKIFSDGFAAFGLLYIGEQGNSMVHLRVRSFFLETKSSSKPLKEFRFLSLRHYKVSR
jgi:hypothetical protein